jgi:1-phosphofructokinase family hexose kinase
MWGAWQSSTGRGGGVVIVAAGLSPAWQQVAVLDRLEVGAVNRAMATYWCASGKVLNVAVALHHLSGERPGEALALSTLGGAAFEPIDHELAEMGLSRRWVRTVCPTRVCTTLVDRATGVATELVENAHPVSADELAVFEAAFAEAVRHAEGVVLTGSLPPGVAPEFFARLLKGVDCVVILDLRGPELLAALEARPTVVKPNRSELEQTLGRRLESDADLREATSSLMQRGARAVVVTAGAGNVWLAADGEVHRRPAPPAAEVVNPIGCGDCLAAGLAHGLAHGLDVSTALERGLQLAAENLKSLLPCDFTGRRQLGAIARR